VPIRPTNFQETAMNTRLQASVALALIGLSTVAITHQAQACGVDRSPMPGRWSLPAYMPGQMSKASHGAAGANELQRRAPITGLYQFTLTAEGNAPPGPPDGTVIDQGFATWHADGTEIMNSGKPPMTSSFCMGVWARTGSRAYELNHYALSWDNTGTVFLGPTNIRESIRLSPNGNSFAGSFQITDYNTDGSIRDQVQGDVAATRLTVDSN
jgi:hypothetical protein